MGLFKTAKIKILIAQLFCKDNYPGLNKIYVFTLQENFILWIYLC
jgi:hypothetical protein